MRWRDQEKRRHGEGKDEEQEVSMILDWQPHNKMDHTDSLLKIEEDTEQEG